MARHRQHSLGEMISSLTFLGCAVYLVISGVDWRDQGNDIRAIISWIAAVFCFMGAIRFQLAQWIMTLMSLWRRPNDKS